MRHCTVYIPENKGKDKTPARGFWRDGGKVFYDYVRPCRLQVAEFTEDIRPAIEALRVKYNQLAMFYVRDGRAYVQSAGNKIDVLSQKVSFSIANGDRKTLRAYIRKFLHSYNGCTVFINKEFYTIEGWKA